MMHPGAIGKALLIVIVSFGILVYAAWAVTWQRPRNAAHRNGGPQRHAENAEEAESAEEINAQSMSATGGASPKAPIFTAAS